MPFFYKGNNMNLPDTLLNDDNDIYDPYISFEYECIEGMKSYAKKHAFPDRDKAMVLRLLTMKEARHYAALLLSEEKDKENEDDAFQRLQNMAEKELEEKKDV